MSPCKPGETPASPLDKPVASLDQQLFGNAPVAAEPELGDDPLGIRKAAERIAAERAAEAAARDASVLQKLSEGLKRSSSRLAEGLAGLSKRKIDRESLEELEELLITSDMGTKVAARIAKNFSKDRFDREVSGEEIKAALASEIAAILKPREQVVDFAEGPKPARRSLRRRQRLGQDHHDRQDRRETLRAGRQHRARRRRHLPRRRRRTAARLVRARQRPLHLEAAGRGRRRPRL